MDTWYAGAVQQSGRVISALSKKARTMSEWMSMEEWLDRYNEQQEREYEKLLGYVQLMEERWRTGADDE